MADEGIIKDVLRSIQQDWQFMTEEECVPVQVALQLMDSSSLGRAHQYDAFQETYKQLQKALKAIVNEHHQGFNSSIGTFHKIQASIQSSQARVRNLKDSLTEAKGNLGSTKPELKSLATSSQNYDEMLQTLSQIEQLELIPEKLESRISEKKFLSAVDVLQEGLRMIRRSDMQDIAALSERRVYLSNQETSLTDIMIEELHSHLYLKSPYCHDRWKAYMQNGAKGTSADSNEAPLATTGERQIHRFLETLDVSTPMIEQATENPEADSFSYVQLLVEALNKLGQLDLAVDSIEQRLPVELFRVVDKTNDEVDQRYPSTMRGFSTSHDGSFAGHSRESGRTKIISDLLWTLYAKFEAIAEGHRVLHEVIAGIVKREGLHNAESLTGGFKELWKLYQSEMRSLLHDYLSTAGDVARSRHTQNGHQGKLSQGGQRDRSKKVFKLSNIDTGSIEIATEQEDLEMILKASVPGLVSNSHRKVGLMNNDANTHHDGSATGHKLLVEPSVFNMGLLLPPSLSFIQRLKAIVPPESDIVMSTLTSFLDDFLVNVFHPQLDETLTELCAQTFIELDAFQKDPHWAQVARKPIFKGTSAFFNLVETFCQMLGTIPHDQAFSQLIITQMGLYQEKCFGWYKASVTRAQMHTEHGMQAKIAAAYAEQGELHDVTQQLSVADGQEVEDLAAREIDILLTDARERPFQVSDLILDRKTVASLCLLYSSMKWLSSKISHLRHITANPIDSSRRSGRSREEKRWTMLGPEREAEHQGAILLPMTEESVIAFDGVITAYEDLAATVLRTLHIELRCRVIYYLTRTLQSSYILEHPVADPEPNILTLNANLVGFDEDIKSHLRETEYRYILTPLSPLLTTLLLRHASLIPGMNRHGAALMRLNILVLQQNLKNLDADVSLQRAARYFSLFDQGAEGILRSVRERSGQTGGNGEEEGGGSLEFSYDELKVLVELGFSEGLASDRREVVVSAKRECGEWVLRLSEELWQS
ncbi:MAG: hypothetical protein M1817_006420 [Caeruleum heppii]|nr:MAG: hypothetical protein M1817_006420 [Caeruleum heppii]